MKTSGIAAALLILVSALPAFGNYNTFINDYTTYKPPVMTSHDTAQDDGAVSLNDSGNEKMTELSSVIGNLKAGHSEKSNLSSTLVFLNKIAPDELKRLEHISTRQDILLKRLGDHLVLKEIEVFTALRNPDILSAQKKVYAEIESFDQVLNLEVSLQQFLAFTQTLNLKAGPLKMKDSIGLKTPSPGIGALKGQVVNHQVNILNHKKQIITQKAITDVRKAFWEYVHIESAQKIDTETIAALNRLKTVATSLYKAGKTSFQDVIKINIKIALLNEELTTLREKKKNISKQILEILDLPQDSVLGSPHFNETPTQVTLPALLFPIARENRPELKVIRESIRKKQKMINMAETMIQTDFTLNLSLNSDAAVNTVGTDAPASAFKQKTMAAMKNGLLARPWYGIDDPWLKRTKAELKSLEFDLVNAENITDRMVYDAWFKVDKSNREKLLYEKQILNLSTSALNVSAREYESGAIAFSQAIGSYTDWLKVRLTIAEKKRDVETGIARLEQLLGRSL